MAAAGHLRVAMAHFMLSTEQSGNKEIHPVNRTRTKDRSMGLLAARWRYAMLIDIQHLELFRRCTTPGQLKGAITEFLAPLGLEYWMYALDLPIMEDRECRYLLSNYSSGWRKRNFDFEHLRLDPAIAHCQSHATPVLWVKDASSYPTRNTDAAVEPVFREADELGLKWCFTVPLHGLGCSWGLASFASTKSAIENDPRPLLPQLHLLAHSIHEAGHRYASDATQSGVPHLTGREQECLYWAASGKTYWEIGQILNISERTVVFHEQNAAHKFGVSSKQAAIARALVLGVINL
jgi:DNA-binding CsgD family transcriptional regulator